MNYFTRSCHRYGSAVSDGNISWKNERMVRTMNLNNLNMNAKIEELMAALKKKEDEKEKNTVLWVLAVIGAVAAVAGIAFAVYRFFAPDYLEDFEEDFDDDFDDYFEDEEE